MKVIILVIGIALFFIFMLFRSVSKYAKRQYLLDIKYLVNNSLNEKLNTFVTTLNNELYEGFGYVKVVDETTFNLYNSDGSDNIRFIYDILGLIVIWKCKYGSEVEDEMRYQHIYNKLKVRESISDEEQIKMAKLFIQGREKVLDKKLDELSNNL